MNKLFSAMIFASLVCLKTLVLAGEAFARVNLDIPSSSGPVNVLIVNPSAFEGTFEHPSNRSVLSFAIFDERLNLVTPVVIGKADPRGPKIDLKPGQVFKFSVNPYRDGQRKLFFTYVTGTAWYGYPLEKGKTYRVVAIYRPWGPSSSGVGSNEILFEY